MPLLEQPATQADLPPFRDASLAPEQRIQDLLARMTREEKIHCLGTVPDVPRLGVQGAGHVEGLHGLALGTAGDWGQGAPLPTTQFPQAYGLGQTWDPELLRRLGAAEAAEARHAFEAHQRGGLVVRAPNADLARDPRWGRTEESFGEDPCLVGTLAAAMVRGLQTEEGGRLRAASLLKHFLSNSNEVGRGQGSSDYDARLFHEYYAEPFRRAVVEAGAQGMMAAYNAVNGVPCTVHPMLREVVRGLWGHDAILCTDGGAYTQLVTLHRRFSRKEEAAAACLKAGINQFLDDHVRGVRAALRQGLLTDADLDEAVAPVLRVMLRLGQLDPSAEIERRRAAAQAAPAPCLSPEHQALAREAMLKSAVLLKNEGLLPLDPAALARVALIGPHADQVVSDWYGGDPPFAVSPLAGLRARLGHARVLHHDGADRAAAAALAASCDAAVVLVGNHPLGHGGWEQVDSVLEGKEGVDRMDIALRDEDLYQAVLQAQPRSVLVLLASFPVACPWSARHAPAILHLCHSGQALGEALAALLCGDASPGGKLTQTWPAGLGQLPPMMDYDIRKGRTYMYSPHQPLWAFGHGLSYTRFSLGPARLGASVLRPGQSLGVALDLANEGAYDGDEVVQLYVRRPASALARSLKELKAFRRVHVPKGGHVPVELELKADDLRHWDEVRGAWALEAGPLELLIGTASDRIHQRLEVEVQA